MKNIRLQIYPWFFAFAVIINSAIAGETNTPSRSDKLIFEGATNFAKGDFDKAIADFSTVIQFDPTNAMAFFDRGSVYRAKGEFEKSIEDFSKNILLDPASDLAFKNRACDFQAIGEFDKALSDWNEGLRLNPNDALALASRGVCIKCKNLSVKLSSGKNFLPFSAFPLSSTCLNAACADVQLRLKNESQQTT